MTATVRKPINPKIRISGDLLVTGVEPLHLVAFEKDRLGRRYALFLWEGEQYKMYPGDDFVLRLNLTVNP